MSMHPTLKASSKHKKQRSVLKRTERLKIMSEKEEWKLGDSVYGLPKIKTIKFKIKKEKAVEKPEVAAVAEGEAAAATPTAEAQTPVKTPTKGQDKGQVKK